MADTLIVIDMQKGNKDIYQRKQVVDNINQRIKQYRSDQKPVVFVQMVSDIKPIFSERWELLSDVDSQMTDTYFNKYYPDAFYETGLEIFLRHHHANSIELAGAQTQLCIDTTIRVAFHLGFQVSILKGGFSTFDSDILTAKQINQHHLSIWQGSFAKIVEI